MNCNDGIMEKGGARMHLHRIRMKRGRRRSLLGATVVLLSVSAASAAQGQPEDRKVIRIFSNGPRRVILAMPKMPPTRTYCVVDAKDWDDSAVVEWDPLLPRSLVRSVTLHPNPLVTYYHISCQSEPARHTLKPGVNFAWTFSSDLCRDDKEGEKCDWNSQELTYGMLVCDSPGEETKPKVACSYNATPPESTPGRLSISLTELRDLDTASTVDPAISAATSNTPLGSAARSYGGLSEDAVTELFQVIADVAVERAKSKGVKLIQAKVQDLVCKDLSLEFRMPNATKEAPPIRVRFERTCDAISGVRLQDLAASGNQLFAALTEDLLRTSLLGFADKPFTMLVQIGAEMGTKGDETEQRLDRGSASRWNDMLMNPDSLQPFDAAFKPVVNTAIEIAADVIQGNQENVRGSGQRLLIALSRAVTSSRHELLRSKALRQVGPGRLDALSFAFAAMAECHRMGRCDAAFVDRMVAHPEDYFKIKDDDWLTWAKSTFDPQSSANSPGLVKDVERKIAKLVKGNLLKGELSEEVAKIRNDYDAIVSAIRSPSESLGLQGEKSAKATMHKQMEKIPQIYERLERLSAGVEVERKKLTDDGVHAAEKGSLDGALKDLAAWKKILQPLKLKVQRDNLALGPLREALDDWAGVKTFISSGVNILSPAPGTTEIAQVRAAAILLFEVIDQYASLFMPADPASRHLFKDVLGASRDLLIASVEHDLTRVVIAGQKLIVSQYSNANNKKYELQRFTSLAGAIGAYMSTYSNNHKPTDAELSARREARKTAINSLIDSQAERRFRLGEPILSVGASPGILIGGALGEPGTTNGSQYTGFRAVPLSLPVGLALDYHAKCNWGVHLELTPLNLGNYMTIQVNDETAKAVPPSPADAVSPSVTLGLSYLFEDADWITFLGVTGGYAYKQGNNEGDVKAESYRGWYVGGSLATYIPFFDFN